MAKQFLSGNEAFAEGIRLAKPQVISAYPITPQTIVVEKLSEMVEDGSLHSEFIHVESEHSALSCAMGASAVGGESLYRHLLSRFAIYGGMPALCVRGTVSHCDDECEPLYRAPLGTYMATNGFHLTA